MYLYWYWSIVFNKKIIINKNYSWCCGIILGVGLHYFVLWYNTGCCDICHGREQYPGVVTSKPVLWPGAGHAIQNILPVASN